MNVKVLTLDEIQKDNPRFCLSAKRVLNRCFECQNYAHCESKKRNIEYENKLKQIKQLKSEIEKIQKQIENL